MANLKEWVERSLRKGEVVEAVVIGNMGWEDYRLEDIPLASQNKEMWGRILSWEQAKPLLDYEFDSGYGAPGCQRILVWTNTHVYFVSQYDGATSLECVPRNPVACDPPMPGG